MTAIDRLDAWLRISPSTVLPAEVLEYLDDVKAENETLRAERDEWHRVAESKQDIIDHMRDANAENAKLREQVLQLKVDWEAERDYADLMEAKEIQAVAENEKLRKIAADIHKALFSLDIDHCQACPRDTINGPCTKYSVFGDDECSIEKDMRELGIEVGE